MLVLCYTPLSQETGGIKMNYYLLGFCVGVVISLVILAFAKKSKGEYDERQVLVRGKAYKVGFLSTLGAGAVYGFISTVLKRPLAEDGIAVFFILLFGVGVFVVYCIMNDAFFSISDKIKPVHLVVLLLLGMVSQGYIGQGRGQPPDRERDREGGLQPHDKSLRGDMQNPWKNS